MKPLTELQQQAWAGFKNGDWQQNVNVRDLSN